MYDHITSHKHFSRYTLIFQNDSTAVYIFLKLKLYPTRVLFKLQHKVYEEHITGHPLLSDVSIVWNLTFVHYKFSPLIHLSYAKFGLPYTADKHFDFYSLIQFISIKEEYVLNAERSSLDIPQLKGKQLDTDSCIKRRRLMLNFPLTVHLGRLIRFCQ